MAESDIPSPGANSDTVSALGADFYDKVYQEGGYEGIYTFHYRHSTYYPMFKYVLAELRRYGVRRVLEVGCGNGAFAHMLTERTDIGYRGFDFSGVAVERAASRVGRQDLFFKGDALDPSSYGGSYDAIVCTEVLEHIQWDREVVAAWKPGTRCVCSVPDFDAVGHVRYFRTENEVRARYGELLKIERVRRVRKPFLSDRSWRSFLRQLRWNRYRPRRLLQLFDIAYLDELGSWYVFTGVRLPSAEGGLSE